jgi:hypothetical protein
MDRPQWAGGAASTNRSSCPAAARLVALKDAIAWLAKEVSKSEHGMKQVQAAAHCVTDAAENGGPMIFARMGASMDWGNNT